MKAVQRLVSHFATAGELISFMWRRKLFLLIPLVIVLMLLALLLVFAQASSIAPFIYSLF
jgi:hypothetical protein